MSLQDRIWTLDGFPDQYGTTVINSPGRSKWNENNAFSGPPGHNKWGGNGRGPPGGGRGPPDGSPPGLTPDRRPPGWNKVDTESSTTERENYPHNYPNNGGTTRRTTPRPVYDREGPYGPDDRVPDDRNEYPQRQQCRYIYNFLLM